MFIEQFREMLQTKNITAYRIAKETGISQGLMSDYNNGVKMPSIQNLVRIANYLDCSIDYLLGRTESPECSDNHKGNDVSNVNSDNNTINNTLSQNYGTQIAGNSAPPPPSPSEECAELVRIYTALPFRQRVELLNMALRLEGEASTD